MTDTDEVGQGAVAEFWDELYGKRPQMWSGRVNVVLADEVADLEPGTALDLGSGEGGDAVWLAQRGWRVTGVDVSTVALARAEAHAAAAGLTDRITWERHDFGATFPSGSFDLVSAQFLQSPVELDRITVLRAAAAAVAPGGTLLVVSHAAAPDWSDHHDAVFPVPAEELAELDLDPEAWTVVRCDAAEVECTGPDGQAGVRLDGVVRVRRNAA
ncbi:class I SAM-dependent methyltransferase [soil metagenome]